MHLVSIDYHVLRRVSGYHVLARSSGYRVDVGHEPHSAKRPECHT